MRNLFKDRRNWPVLLLGLTLLCIRTVVMAQQGNQVIPGAASGAAATNGIYAVNYGIHNDWQWIWDGTINNTSAIITSGAATGEPSFAPTDVGKTIFCTNIPIIGSTGMSTSTTQLPGQFQVTTIASYQSPTQVTAAAPAVANNAGNAMCAWGTPDDTTGASSPAILAANAAINNCTNLILPGANKYGTGPGAIAITHDWFVADTARVCPRSAEGARGGAGIIGQGSNASYVLVLPSYNYATCTHALSTKACDASTYDGINMQNVTWWGFGESGNGGSKPSVNLFEVGRGATSGNSYIINVKFIGRLGGNAGSVIIGCQLNGGNSFVSNVDCDGYGRTNIQISGEVGQGLYGIYAGDSAERALVVGPGAGLQVSIYGSEFGPSGSLNGCNVDILSGTLHDYGGKYSNFNLVSSGYSTAGVCAESGATADLHGTWGDVNGDNTASEGFFAASGGTIICEGCRTTATGTGGIGLINNGTFTDAGGNQGITGVSRYSGSGVVFGSASIGVTTQVNTNWSLPAGSGAGQWGTTPSVACPGALFAGAGNALRESCTITVGSGTVGANPVVTITFPTAFFVAPTCRAQMTSGTAALATVTAGVPSVSSVALTYQGTPGASTTIGLVVDCSN